MMDGLRNVAMTEEDYLLFQKFLETRKKNNTSDKVERIENNLSIIEPFFTKETLGQLRISSWRYPKDTVIPLTDKMFYIQKGTVRREFNNEFMGYVSAGNWIGTMKVSRAIANNNSQSSWQTTKESYISTGLLTTNEECILISVELDQDEINMFHNDFKVISFLMNDLTSIILANDVYAYLLKYKTKVSILAAYLWWEMEEKLIEDYWEPAPTNIGAILNFTLTEVRRNTDKLVELKIICPIEDVNNKRKCYRIECDAKDELLKLSGLSVGQIKALSRCLFI